MKFRYASIVILTYVFGIYFIVDILNLSCHASGVDILLCMDFVLFGFVTDNMISVVYFVNRIIQIFKWWLFQLLSTLNQNRTDFDSVVRC